MDNLLEIKDLSVNFRTSHGRMKALRNVSFGVKKGKILGIVGESGSGKSTVLWSIMGLLAQNAEIAGGSILFQDRDLLKLQETALRALRGEEVAVVFQDPMTSQAPLLSYGRQMADILYRRRGMSKREKRQAAIQMLGKVGIPDPAFRLDQYPHEFSGGMRQRAGIAMALLAGPNLLVADEPTTALDVTMEAQIIHLLRDLQAETEATVAVVSHNLGLIAELCDDVVVMYAGEVIETGTVRQIFHAPRHPYTQALLDCDPARIPERSARLPVIAGDLPDLVIPPPGCIFAERCPHLMPICMAERPPATTDENGGMVRCHIQSGVVTPKARSARARAEPAGRTDVEKAEPLLETRELNVRFATESRFLASIQGRMPKGLDAVLDVSLTVRPGETLGVVGESGSGKSTLGRAILNLVSVTSGQVLFEGNEIHSLSERAFKPLRRNMAMMFQDPNGSLSPRMTVRALITEPLLIHGLGTRDLDREAERLADMVRLPRPLLSRFPNQLSGGQARRVGVARALALSPRLIIADEPTAGLDVSVQGEILNLMADLQAEHGLGYLIITHNLPVIRHISDRIAIMYLGRIVEQGPADDIFRHQYHPYTASLVQGVPQPDPDLRRTHVGLKGEVPSLLDRPRGCDFASRCPVARPHCHDVKPPHRDVGRNRTIACHFPLS
ncbi:ABC transporter ATP-binding protein [Ensifer adhaerens]|uniref:dipeptide ABC transporter ATP-binding protein n=1 Tax=Ensifer adhaerens TaxID=106592 RepID=UPI001CC1852B|nr:ABC transporter ATP-binding protein [Ensifer adhaerens]MBZ7926285.1 ABC transporter ATP-binding protein [Ensifer adhaerens]UAX97355.1 ABC transporter ATP-binding protein [Ensifer adhaerens]UAY03526.1 ABC transporter ATP-binding protein [Ensifer adhaerens]UAY11510.1 ABC transporter ATP-binding protein [Ensifer adhaerens]